MENQYYDFGASLPKVKTCRAKGSMYGQIRIRTQGGTRWIRWVEQVVLIEMQQQQLVRQEKRAFSTDGGRLWGV